MDYEIIHLSKEQWKDHVIPIRYTATEYYDVSVEPSGSGFTASVEKKTFDTPVTHTPEEYDFPDKLYQEHWEDAYAWGIVIDGTLAAAVETNPEKWSNRLRVTELWVADAYQKQGVGHALMEVVKEQARQERRRTVILETQSCNVNAVDFYLHEGFTLIGMDTCCYRNNDLQRKEVRLEMGWFPERKERLSRDEIEIRMESSEDWHAVERMTQRSFWNKHSRGCDEHYLVHKLWQHQDYLPAISRIACKGDEVIGSIMYSKAYVQDGDKRHDIVTFGPLCIDPEWQGCGVGEMLLKETMELAAEAGYPGIVIFGEPDYYPQVGFKTCDHFEITTKDGKNFNAFMGIELIKDGMSEIKGRFYESEVFEQLPREEAEKYNELFEPLKKQHFPSQWD